jgi:hypothetical protein
VRALFSLGVIVAAVAIVGLLVKKQLTTQIQVPSATQAAPTQLKPIEVPKQVQQELNNAANEAAKRLEQVEGKQ